MNRSNGNKSDDHRDDRDNPNRKTRLNAKLDELISEEKDVLSGSGEGRELELQDRLDHFMNRLQQRMEPFTRQTEPGL
ncbi:MAG: hypothetical protein AUJ57_05880 [Zetaproteobacteria bacterium CG1_02_53_45]|nr:MAG: hypothetical protein AUJ57_05880 [Zetaproteobacteria bacterium CG1_02_53_45]